MVMGDISPHFSRKEFACKCGCGFATVDVELVQVLEDVRSFTGAPIHISSGCRCRSHNRAVGGKPASDVSMGSKHMYGVAADVVMGVRLQRRVFAYLDTKYPNKCGIGLYPERGFMHIDVRPNKARWGI